MDPLPVLGTLKGPLSLVGPMVPSPKGKSFDAGLSEPVKWGDFRLVKKAKNGNHLMEVVSTGKTFRKSHSDRFYQESRFGQDMAERTFFGLFESTGNRTYLERMFDVGSRQLPSGQRTIGGRFSSVTQSVAIRDGITEDEARKQLIDHMVYRENLPSEEKARTPFIKDSP